MKKLIQPGLYALVVLLAVACTPEKKPVEGLGPEKDSPTKPEKTHDRYWNDLARYVAGLPALEGSVLDSLEHRPEAEAQRAFYQSAPWKEYRDYLKKVEAFAQQEFAPQHQSDRVMLYPFSGPDFITAYTLFPNAKRYIFWGLEPEGHLPDVRTLPAARMPHNLQSVQHSLRTIIRRSFFVTSEMGGDFGRAELNGSLPVILTFMAERGNEILEVERIKINMQGEIEPIGADSSYAMRANDSLVTGMRYRFRKSEEAPVQELVYIVFDAQDFPGDPHFSRHAELVKWLRSQGTVNTYFKSASYLMHWRSTEALRNLILDISDFVFQDDTGIRYGFFDQEAWDITLYGNYARPVYPFEGQYETALANAYTQKRHPVKPIGFQMGYQQGRGEDRTSLLIARKKRPQTNKPAAKPGAEAEKTGK
ncbi:MAG: hypothetical protein LW884_11475 [Bacteroidetes bacterium]|jgi:hypothetical protein|nr:hypothetical protein [Bacteroidota bacterium]